jgi:hypothetical protein
MKTVHIELFSLHQTIKNTKTTNKMNSKYDSGRGSKKFGASIEGKKIQQRYFLTSN